MSPAEVRRLIAAAEFLRANRYAVSHLTVAVHHVDEWTCRDLVRAVKKSIIMIQRRAGMKHIYWAEALEGEPTVHSHLLVGMPRGAMDKLDRLIMSEKFRQYDRMWDGSAPTYMDRMRLDGSVNTFLDLKPVRRGDLDYPPANIMADMRGLPSARARLILLKQIIALTPSGDANLTALNAILSELA